MKEAITHLVTWYQDTLASGGYPLIAVLMAMESTVVPVPSELIIPFAAHQAFVAHQAHASGSLSLWGIVVAGTLGSWIGATIMYWASRWAGRPLVLRYGGYFLVPEAKLHAAERWATRFGSFGVFVARLLPVVRHLIGIPMGIVKMDFRWYSLFTLIGSGIWCAVLVWVGVEAGDMHRVKLCVCGGVAVLGLLYYFLVHRFMKH
jgi:membrane protein DedA with SNARE-associated domain